MHFYLNVLDVDLSNILPLNEKIEHKVIPEMYVIILNGLGLKAH